LEDVGCPQSCINTRREVLSLYLGNTDQSVVIIMMRWCSNQLQELVPARAIERIDGRGKERGWKKVRAREMGLLMEEGDGSFSKRKELVDETNPVM